MEVTSGNRKSFLLSQRYLGVPTSVSKFACLRFITNQIVINQISPHVFSSFFPSHPMHTLAHWKLIHHFATGYLWNTVIAVLLFIFVRVFFFPPIFYSIYQPRFYNRPQTAAISSFIYIFKVGKGIQGSVLSLNVWKKNENVTQLHKKKKMVRWQFKRFSLFPFFSLSS